MKSGMRAIWRKPREIEGGLCPWVSMIPRTILLDAGINLILFDAADRYGCDGPKIASLEEVSRLLH